MSDDKRDWLYKTKVRCPDLPVLRGRLSFFFFFKQMYCPIWISPMGNSGCFSLGKPAAVHAGCFSAATIHRTLTRTTGSFPCSQMLMHAIAQGGFTDTVRESALKVDSGRKKKSLAVPGNRTCVSGVPVRRSSN